MTQVMMRAVRVLLIAVLTLPGTVAVAGNTPEEANDTRQTAQAPVSLLPTEGLSGSFEQRIVDADGSVLSESRGQFALRKPHFFRWSIQEPGQQLLVADGEWLWQYDLDLETINRQPMGLDRNAPLRLLTQSLTALASDYDLQWIDDTLTLTPLVANSAFESMQVLYRDGVPQQLSIDDGLGQTIDIVFSVSGNDVPPLSTFVFQPPNNVDIYTQEP